MLLFFFRFFCEGAGGNDIKKPRGITIGASLWVQNPGNEEGGDIKVENGGLVFKWVHVHLCRF